MAPAATTPTEDERWIVVDGRRWRRTDPALAEPYRQQLVDELMAARRAVGAARRAGDRDAEAAARRRVGDAKVALGERGEPWWEPATEAGRDRRLRAVVLALARHRAPGGTICPSDVARAVGGAPWRALMEPVRAAARVLAHEGQVVVTQKGTPLDPGADWRGPVRIGIPPA